MQNIFKYVLYRESKNGTFKLYNSQKQDDLLVTMQGKKDDLTYTQVYSYPVPKIDVDMNLVDCRDPGGEEDVEKDGPRHRAACLPARGVSAQPTRSAGRHSRSVWKTFKYHNRILYMF